MTIRTEETGRPRSATFGAGGSEPYAQALRSADPNPLYLEELRYDAELPTTEPASATEFDVARWNADADGTDLRLLASVRGPVLDVGCGPARMVRAAMDLGLDALGIDVSPAAIEIARASGVRVLQRSVFDPLPGEGRWQTVLLVDGNIGIGGDVHALLARCRQLICGAGEVVVELHPEHDRDRTYTGRLVDTLGGRSASFPWAEIGLRRLVDRAEQVGLELRQAWSADERSFCRLVNIRR
jgi:SAM-dependent methyltransferase